MPQIQPIHFPAGEGIGTYFSVRPYPWELGVDTTTVFSWQILTEESGVMIISGTYTMTEQEFNLWTNDPYAIDLIAGKVPDVVLLT